MGSARSAYRELSIKADLDCGLMELTIYLKRHIDLAFSDQRDLHLVGGAREHRPKSLGRLPRATVVQAEDGGTREVEKIWGADDAQ